MHDFQCSSHALNDQSMFVARLPHCALARQCATGRYDNEILAGTWSVTLIFALLSSDGSSVSPSYFSCRLTVTQCAHTLARFCISITRTRGGVSEMVRNMRVTDGVQTSTHKMCIKRRVQRSLLSSVCNLFHPIRPLCAGSGVFLRHMPQIARVCAFP